MTVRERSVAIVTGGAGAIGAAVCHRLAAAGRQVVVVDLDPARQRELAGELTGDGHRGVGLDVADTDAVAERDRPRSRPTSVRSRTLINVAGWDRFVPFVDTTPGVLGPSDRHQLPRAR